jgi:hypothetical protein
MFTIMRVLLPCILMLYVLKACRLQHKIRLLMALVYSVQSNPTASFHTYCMTLVLMRTFGKATTLLLEGHYIPPTAKTT